MKLVDKSSWLKNFKMGGEPHYRAIGITLGSILGLLLGVVFFSEIERSLGIALGLALGTAVGLIIGDQLDARSKRTEKNSKNPK